MKCPNCGSLDVRSHFGITELAYYECESCGRAIPNNYGDEKSEKVPIPNPPKTYSCGIPDFRFAEKKSEVIPVKVQPSLKEAVKAVAGFSVSKFCRTAIIEKLERIKEESH